MVAAEEADEKRPWDSERWAELTVGEGVGGRERDRDLVAEGGSTPDISKRTLFMEDQLSSKTI